MFFLEYDLRKQRNYQPLYDKLKEFGAVRYLESGWVFNRHNTTAAGLRDFFRQLVDADDAIMVAEISTWAGWNLDGDPNAAP